MVDALVVLSTLLFFLAAPPYIINTLRGHTKPERATWLIWSVLGIIAFVAQVRLGATWSLLFTGLDTLGTILVFTLSIGYGVGGWTFLDRIALIVAVVGVVISLAAHEPIVAIVGVILADVSGTVLTILKAFRDPGSETTSSWLLVGAGALCGVVLVRSLNLSLLAYPFYLMIANFSIPLAQAAGRLHHHSGKVS